MARKRFIRGRRGSFRGFRKGRRGSTGSLNVQDVMLAGALYGVARPMVASALPTMFKVGPIDSDNVILAGLGWYLAKKTSGVTKAIGLIAIGTEAGFVTNQLISPSTNSSNTNQW